MIDDPDQMNWIRWVAQGKSIRTAPAFPLTLSRKEAHCLGLAPLNTVFREAMVYALLRGNGGEDGLFRPLLAFYQRGALDEEFLRGLIRFLVRFEAGTSLTNREFNILMAYIEHCREEGIRCDLKGRSLAALLRRAEAWERDREQQAYVQWLRGNPRSWPAVAIDDFEQTSGKDKFLIKQLTTLRQLYQEGRAMHHCVATYANRCANGFCSIWSLRQLDTEGKMKRLVTLEVNAEWEIVQARAPYNATPADQEMGMIMNWAAKAGLNLEGW